jgi:hypothetical protein
MECKSPNPLEYHSETTPPPYQSTITTQMPYQPTAPPEQMPYQPAAPPEQSYHISTIHPTTTPQHYNHHITTNQPSHNIRPLHNNQATDLQPENNHIGNVGAKRDGRLCDCSGAWWKWCCLGLWCSPIALRRIGKKIKHPFHTEFILAGFIVSLVGLFCLGWLTWWLYMTNQGFSGLPMALVRGKIRVVGPSLKEYPFLPDEYWECKTWDDDYECEYSILYEQHWRLANMIYTSARSSVFWPMFTVYVCLQLMYLCAGWRLRSHFSKYMKSKWSGITACFTFCCCTSCTIGQMGSHMDRIQQV